jgi:hypothetical protein
MSRLSTYCISVLAAYGHSNAHASYCLHTQWDVPSPRGLSFSRRHVSPFSWPFAFFLLKQFAVILPEAHIDASWEHQGQALAQLLAGLQAMREQLDQFHHQFRRQIHQVGVNMPVYMSNAQAGSDSTLLWPTNIAGGRPANAPETVAQVRLQKRHAVNELLSFYQLPLAGNMADKRSRSLLHLGVRP